MGSCLKRELIAFPSRMSQSCAKLREESMRSILFRSRQSTGQKSCCEVAEDAEHDSYLHNRYSGRFRLFGTSEQAIPRHTHKSTPNLLSTMLIRNSHAQVPKSSFIFPISRLAGMIPCRGNHIEWMQCCKITGGKCTHLETTSYPNFPMP
jgi:hypothetical protein